MRQSRHDHPVNIVDHRLERLAGDRRVLGKRGSNISRPNARGHRQVVHVLDEVSRCAGTQFDPALAKVFVTLDFSQYQQSVEEQQALASAPTPLLEPRGVIR